MSDHFSIDKDILELQQNKKTHRILKIASEFQKILSITLTRCNVKDPVLFDNTVLISYVELSRDFTHAKVYFAKANDNYSEKELQIALNRNAYIFIKYIGKALQIKTIPKILFYVDTQNKTLFNLNKIFDSL